MLLNTIENNSHNEGLGDISLDKVNEMINVDFKDSIQFLDDLNLIHYVNTALTPILMDKEMHEFCDEPLSESTIKTFDFLKNALLSVNNFLDSQFGFCKKSIKKELSIHLFGKDEPDDNGGVPESIPGNEGVLKINDFFTKLSEKSSEIINDNISAISNLTINKTSDLLAS